MHFDKKPSSDVLKTKRVELVLWTLICMAPGMALDYFCAAYAR
jgi:hypothetical protein